MIFHARKCLLFNDQQIWIQKEDGLFDVTIGGFNGTQVCETVGNIKRFMINGLYKDDGLAIFTIAMSNLAIFSGSKA